MKKSKYDYPEAGGNSWDNVNGLICEMPGCGAKYSGIEEQACCFKCLDTFAELHHLERQKLNEDAVKRRNIKYEGIEYGPCPTEPNIHYYREDADWHLVKVYKAYRKNPYDIGTLVFDFVLYSEGMDMLVGDDAHWSYPLKPVQEIDGQENKKSSNV